MVNVPRVRMTGNGDMGMRTMSTEPRVLEELREVTDLS